MICTIQTIIDLVSVIHMLFSS